MRTVVQGCGFKGYPWMWWWHSLCTMLKRRNLLLSARTHMVRT